MVDDPGVNDCDDDVLAARHVPCWRQVAAADGRCGDAACTGSSGVARSRREEVPLPLRVAHFIRHSEHMETDVGFGEFDSRVLRKTGGGGARFGDCH